MSKLSLLGAQRVKALESMLDDKLAAEIEQLPKVDRQSAHNTVLDEFGLLEDYEEARKKVKEANEILARINGITGDKDYASLTTSSYSHMMRTPHAKRVEELLNARKAKVVELKAANNRKKQRLWLCETLEEAKAIVGMEDDE